MSNRKNTDFIDQLNRELNAEEEAATTEEALAETAERKRADFAALLDQSLKSDTKKLSVGDKIRGKILVLGREDVFVSTGTRHDGVVPRRELLDESGNCPFKQDDVIDLYVTMVRGSEIRLSRSPTGKNVADDLEDAFDMMMPIQGRVVEVCKGGVRVNLKGKLAFCPISQLDVKRVESAEEYVGKSLEFRITKFEESGRNIVVSRRDLLQEERALSMGSFLEENKDGDIVQGKVARLEKFGAFVELAPGIDGLVHISEMAWSRVGDPSELLLVGQPVTVKILKRETVNGRAKISLSIKQATERPSADAPGQPMNPAYEDPWTKFTVGQTLSGKVTRKELYGLFVQLEPGVTGLLHKTKALENPEISYDKLKVGDAVTVQIGEIKLGERRISLGFPRDPNENDWRQHVQQPQTGSLGTLADKLKAALESKKK